MAKTNATRLCGRQSQVVPIEADIVKTDHQMDTAIEVKGNTSTVTVSQDKKNEEGDQIMDSEKETQIITSADAVDTKEEAPIESAETEMREEMQKCEDSQMDIVTGSTATVTVTLKKNEVQKETNGGEQMKKTPGKGKRKAPSTVETSPPKKTKLDDGYRLYVGNLDNSKTFDEVKNSLANYFMAQGLLVQDIRVDRSKKYAFVDLASEMDLTKGLTLNGEMMHDKPLKIAKAKAPPRNKTAPAPNDTLYLTNLPKYIKETDLKNIFETAVSITIPKCDSKSKGFAFVKFAAVADAEKAKQSSQSADLFKGDVRVNFTLIKPNSEKKEFQSKRLIVMGLAETTTAETLKSAFEGSLEARVPVEKKTGASRRFGFVDFESEENCKAVKEAMKNCEIDGCKVTVAFAEALPPGGQPAGPGAAKRKRKKAKKRAAGKSQDAVKEVENKV